MKVIMKAVAGSHLFGTNTPSSDKDFKGVFLPDPRDILLNKTQEVISKTTGDDKTKNSKDDVDVELYSLTKFMKMVTDGDTVALELLFTPEEMIIESTHEWREILKNRNNLISKSIKNAIGYSRAQLS